MRFLKDLGDMTRPAPRRTWRARLARVLRRLHVWTGGLLP